MSSSRKTHVFRLGIVSSFVALATMAGTASAGVRLNGVDFGAYPQVGVTKETTPGDPGASHVKMLGGELHRA